MRMTLLAALLLAGCGFNGTQKLETNNSKQDIVQSGQSYAYVVFRVEFIEQLKRLCKDSFIRSKFDSEEAYNKEVADCTFKNLSIINVNPGTAKSFVDDYCKKDKDLSSFTLEQQAQITQTCGALK